MKRHPRLYPPLFWLPASFAFLVLLLLAAGVPSLGAWGADILRGLVGSEAVAQLETGLFETLDTYYQLLYRSGLEQPQAPWQSLKATGAPAAGPASEAREYPVPESRSISTPPSTTVIPPDSSAWPDPSMPGSASAAELAGQESRLPSSESNAETLTAGWPPAGIAPLGSLEGEGIWEEYIHNPSGRAVAFRTFLQPDPGRPYAVVGVVAFHLTHSRLNFVLGTVEPFSPGDDLSARSGMIPPADRQAGALLAAFNGGFLSVHGKYGAMADGLVALPPQDGLGTVAIYRDGEVRIGAWGSDILPTEEIRAWRQNGPLVLQNGRITPKAEQTRMEDWGGTLDGNVAVWRSALGLSADRQVLVYFAGDKLTVPALARAMLAAGVEDGMQLDINAFWVHFTAIRWDGARPVPESLFPHAMRAMTSRYLESHERDYFYITAR